VNTDGVVTYLTRKAVSQAAPVDSISSLGISRVLMAKKSDRRGYLTFCACAVRCSTQTVVRAYSIGDRSKEDGGRDNRGERLGGEGYRQGTIKS